jgi:hypothetical protein
MTKADLEFMTQLEQDYQLIVKYLDLKHTYSQNYKDDAYYIEIPEKLFGYHPISRMLWCSDWNWLMHLVIKVQEISGLEIALGINKNTVYNQCVAVIKKSADKAWLNTHINYVDKFKGIEDFKESRKAVQVLRVIKFSSSRVYDEQAYFDVIMKLFYKKEFTGFYEELNRATKNNEFKEDINDILLNYTIKMLEIEDHNKTVYKAYHT